MVPASPEPLFSRDLKHLVGGRHTLLPQQRRRRHARWLWVVSVPVLLGAWLAQASLPVRPSIPAPAAPPVPSATAPEVVNTPLIESAPTVTDENSNESMATDAELTWHEYEVRPRDTLTLILGRYSIPAADALRIVAEPGAAVLSRLIPGRAMKIGINPQGHLQKLFYGMSAREILHVALKDDAVSTHIETSESVHTTRIVAGTIKRNLFLDGAQAGLTDQLIMELAQIFGWDIDFALDLRENDEFVVAFEEEAVNEKLQAAHIAAARFTNQGKTLYAFRHVDSDGQVNYYNEKGNNLRGTFLRTPMKISRITSVFSKRRFHPILKTWRSHRGVDYGAPVGTPVLATADGRVAFAGTNGGYGRCVILRHGGQYSTLYAHLSRLHRGLSGGDRVRQGQVVGYVGQTGLATGPHLHYEFRVNGQHRNPLTFESPRARPIADSEKPEYLEAAGTWIARLAQHTPVQVATNQ